MKHILLGSCLVLFASSLSAADKKPGKPVAKPVARPAGAAPASPAAPQQPAAQQAPVHNSGPRQLAKEAFSNSGTRYGMAGCGLGALLIEKDEMFPQLGATFLNGSSGNQTFGLTSGTSNCVEGRSDVAVMEQEVYMTANLSSLSREAAQGSGEHLNALAEVFGCQEGDSVRLGELSQKNYAQLFAANDPEAVLQNYLHVVNTDPQLAKSCTRAG